VPDIRGEAGLFYQLPGVCVLFGRAKVLSLGAKLIGRTLGIGTSAVHESDARRVFTQAASALIFARLRGSFAGLKAELIEPHELDATRARKVPAKVIGCRLSGQEAQSCLTGWRESFGGGPL
jgi:hypothetical protein